MSSPSVSLTLEPNVGNVVRFLECAPPVSGGSKTGHVNLHMTIRNAGASGIRINKIELSVPDSATAAKSFTVTLPASGTLAPNATLNWTQSDDYVFALPASLSIRVRVWADGYADPDVTHTTMLAHVSPTPEKSYRFWGAVRDLRRGEFWEVHGTGHGQSNSAQLFAYDVGVAVESGSGHEGRLPNTDGKKNEHYRVWNKPVYAIADGTVVHFRDGFPTNAVPGVVDPEIEKFWKPVSEGGQGQDGNGNFFTITNGTETVLYAHLQAGWLNAALLHTGATVKAGDFLGLAGNAGASGGPHLHIHANRTTAGDTTSWTDMPRPMPLRGARAVRWSSLGSDASAAPWVALDGRGIPTTACAVWPSDAAVTDLREARVRHFAVTAAGQLWVATTDRRIRTTRDRLPGFGVFLDVDPGGLAKEVVARGSKPYVIGMDDKIWEGLSTGWVVLPSSPTCARLALDQSNGKVWVVTLANRIFSFDPGPRTWTEHPGGGRAKDICVRNGAPTIIGMDDEIFASAGANGWSAHPGPGKGKRIAVDDASGKLWVVGMNDGMWSYAGSGNWSEHPGGGRAKEIAVHGGLPYVIGMDDGIWKSIGTAGWWRLNLVEPA